MNDDQVELRTRIANIMFRQVCLVLRKNGWNFSSDKEKLNLELQLTDGDSQMSLGIQVLPDIHLLLLVCPMPFSCQKNNRLEMAIAVSAINKALSQGCFDYEIRTGDLFFRLTTSFLESFLAESNILALIVYCQTIFKEYSDHLSALASGNLSLNEFVDFFSND